MCNKHADDVKGCFLTWLEECISCVKKDYDKKSFLGENKHFKDYIPKYIRAKNDDEKIEKDEQKYIYLSTKERMYIIWYNMKLDDKDEDEVEELNEKMEKDAKKELKNIISGLENELVKEANEECKA